MAELGNLAEARAAKWIGRPSHDELNYKPPSGYECAEPGTVLRTRDVELAFLGLVPQPLRAIQLLYRIL